MSDAVVTAPAAPAAATPAQPAVPAANAAPKPAPTAEEFFEYKANGKPVKIPKSEAEKKLALADGAFQKFEEAANIRKDAEAKLSRIKTPKEAIKFLNDPESGLDPSEVRAAFEEWYNYQYIEPEKMTPAERENRELKEKLSKFEAEQLAKKEAEDKEIESKMDLEEAQKLQTEILGLLDECQMPKTRFTANRLAYWMRVNESKGLNAPAQVIVEQVRREANDIMQSLVKNAEGESLLKILGDDTAKKLRKYDLERIRKNRGIQQPPPEEQNTNDELPPLKPGERITPQEVRRRARLFK